MVNDPVATTFATALPAIDPINPLATTAVFAGPPENRPVIEYDMLMKKLPAPVLARNAPKRMNMNTKVDATPVGRPNIPSVVRDSVVAIRSIEYPLWISSSGIYGPK